MNKFLFSYSKIHAFQLPNRPAPRIRDYNAFLLVVVICHHDGLGGGEDLLGVFIADLVDEGQAFVADTITAHVNRYLLGELNGRQVRDVDVRDDQVEIEEVCSIE